jgi:hypothetical protein
MLLPDADLAVIPAEKLRDYVLSSTHPVGRGRTAPIVSIWIVPLESPRPRLVTLYPSGE